MPTTDRVLTSYRIGDPNGIYPIWNTEGARLYPGRWNTRASPILYTSEHYSTAMLEKLVHANTIMPPNQHYIQVTIPNGTSYEIFSDAAHPGWNAKNEQLCKAYGEAWFTEARSAILLVPSIPARLERNILVNLRHADAERITYELPAPVWWDDRLYR